MPAASENGTLLAGVANGNLDGKYRPWGLRLAKSGRPFVIGHRGASAVFPENTVLSITQAIADGAEGFEFDIQKTADDEIVILHDRTLDRTTTGTGRIALKNYHGDIEYVTTKGFPKCPIARFQDIVDVLLEERHAHVWAVVDVKMNIPVTILKKIADILRERDPDLTAFSNRLVLGLWHPMFLPAARKYLPELRIVHIGASISIARKHFRDVDGYSMMYASLAGSKGKRFIEEAHLAAKPVLAWTVNREVIAADCQNWGVDAILTDKTKQILHCFENQPIVTNSFIPAWVRRLLYLLKYGIVRTIIYFELIAQGPLEAIYD